MTVFQIVLSNAIGAMALALLAWCIGLVCRRPAVLRALWILVLLKLLTPPLWNMPVRELLPRHEIPQVQAMASPEERVSVQTPVETSISAIGELPVSQAAPAPHESQPRARISAWHVLGATWGTGSAICIVIGLLRLRSLRKILRASSIAPVKVQEEVKVLARRLGLRRSPVVWLVPGPICPSLWAFAAAPRILLPADLWERLENSQRQTLLAHELSHLKRRDHWVRLLEVAATVAWWWHPAVWVARRQIHDAEEQCCDAWVLWMLPACARSYGTALLEAVEFVSMYRPARPALAAGMGEFRHLKRRLLMIKQRSVARALSRAGLLSVCGVAGLVLPVGASLGQMAAPGAPPVATSSALPDDSGQASEVAQARAEIQRLRAELRRAEARLALLEHGMSGIGGAGLSPVAPLSGGAGGGMALGGSSAAGAPGGIGGGGGAMVGSASVAPMNPGAGAGTYGAAGVTTATPPAFGRGGMGGPRGRFGARLMNRDQRLDELERQLSALLDEVRSLKNEDSRQSHEPASGEQAK